MPRVNRSGDSTAIAIERSGDLFETRDACQYNEAERQFSRFVEARLMKLLKGELNCFPLLRRYHQEQGRLAAPVPEQGVDERELRLPMVEEVLTRVLLFLQTGMPGGPIAQEARDGQLIERQLYTTRFPHIVIERVDTYESASRRAVATEWAVQRMQNQHIETRINRVLDIANLGLEFFKHAR